MTLIAELADTIRAVDATARPAVVAIGSNGRGSGFVIAPGKVVTNAHNLRDRTVSVHFADGRSEQASVAGSDVDGDLVVLAVDTGAIAPLAWAEVDTALGDTVLAVSRGRGTVSVTSGQVSAVATAFAGPRGRSISNGLEHTAPLRRGSSGGPLLDTQGRVVGINTHRVDPGFYVARATDHALRELVVRLAEGHSVRRPHLGVAVATGEVADRLRAAVGLPAVGGLLVREVEPDSPAASAGVIVGDVLVRAGDTTLSSPAVLLDALATAGDALAVHLVRGVDELTVQVVLRGDAAA